MKGAPKADLYDEFVPFYDLAYADRAAEIAFYTSLVRPEDTSVLELGCGTGSILAGISGTLLTRCGAVVRTVGVDRSALMLRHARDRHPQLQLVCGDLSRPPLRGPFDLIVCAFNTLQMLESDAALLRTFEAAHHLLGPEGRLVFDLYNPSHEAPGAPSTADRRNRVVRSFADSQGHRLDVHEDATETPDGTSVELDWRVMDLSVTPPIVRARLVLRLYHYAPATIESLLRSARLRIRERYGDVLRSPFDGRTSKKQVVVCSR
jgi:SAM-dependent methyltransferase